MCTILGIKISKRKKEHRSFFRTSLRHPRNANRVSPVRCWTPPRGTLTFYSHVMMVIGATFALRAVPLTRFTASARSSSPAAAVHASSVASTNSSSSGGRALFGGASFLSAGAVGLSARVRGADHALAHKSIKKRVVSADASASADASTAAAVEKAKSLRIALSISGWFFLNAVFGESSIHHTNSSFTKSSQQNGGAASSAGVLPLPLLFSFFFPTRRQEKVSCPCLPPSRFALRL